MKIILYTTCSSDENVIRNRLTPYISEALKQEYRVSVITVSGDPFNIDHQLYTHIRVRGNQLRGANFIKRAFAESSLATKILKESSCYQEDDEKIVTIITIPSMFLLFQYKRRRGINILDIRDLTWEYLQKGFVNNLARVFFRGWAKKKIKQFDYITVTNCAEKRYLLKTFGVPKNKVVLVSNGITEQQYNKVRLVRESNNQRKRVTYIGNVGLAQDLSTLIDAAERTPHLDFYIVGDGTDYKRIYQLANKKDLENLFIVGRAPWESLLDYYSSTDILYAQLTPIYSSAVPSKLYEYLTTGKRVVFGGGGEASSVLLGFKGVSVIPACDSKSLADKLIEVAKLPALSNEAIKENRAQIEQFYIRERSVGHLYKIIKNK